MGQPPPRGQARWWHIHFIEHPHVPPPGGPLLGQLGVAQTSMLLGVGAVGSGPLHSWGIVGDTCLCLQMYGSQDGCVDEGALSSILKTALGVAELTVTDLFRAIDEEETGRITFGEQPGRRGRTAALCRRVPRRRAVGDTIHARQGPAVSRATQDCPKEDSSPDLAGMG